MGGDPREIESYNELEKASKDLDEVEFYFWPDTHSNMGIFDPNVLLEISRKEIKTYLKANGIKYKESIVGGGGGGLETLRDIINTLISNKDLIGFLISFFGILKSAYKKFLEEATREMIPTVTVSYGLRTNADINKIGTRELDYLISVRLANLLLIAKEISKLISRNHGYMRCNFHISVDLPSIDTNIYFQMPHKYQRELNYKRFLNIIKNIRVHKKLFTSFEFTSWFAIRRADSKVKRVNGSFNRGKDKSYYLIVSTRLIKDSFGSN